MNTALDTREETVALNPDFFVRRFTIPAVSALQTRRQRHSKTRMRNLICVDCLMGRHTKMNDECPCSHRAIAIEKMIEPL